MREPQKKEFNGVIYCITPLNPFKSTAIFADLLKIASEPLALLMGGKKDIATVKEIMEGADKSKIGNALMALTKNIEPQKLEPLMKSLLQEAYTTYSTDGGEKFSKLSNIDGHFAGYSILHLWKVIGFSLEVNFSDFLDVIAAQEK
jgi:hypothetical protein